MALLPLRLREEPLRASLVSHTLRRMYSPGAASLRPIADTDLPTLWQEGRLPTPPQLADNLILWIGDNQPTAFDWAEATVHSVAAMIGIPILPAGDAAGFAWLNEQLTRLDWYRIDQTRPPPTLRIMLGVKGWEKYEELKRQRIESRTIFMALKFGKPDVERVVDACVRPAVTRTGFTLKILTDQQAAGLIDDQIRASLLAARLVISDLTHGSHGAYWEAGFGEGRGIPVIYTCERTFWETSKVHFDTNHMVTIIWDPDNLKKAEDALASTIRATLRAEAKQTDD